MMGKHILISWSSLWIILHHLIILLTLYCLVILFLRNEDRKCGFSDRIYNMFGYYLESMIFWDFIEDFKEETIQLIIHIRSSMTIVVYQPSTRNNFWFLFL